MKKGRGKFIVILIILVTVLFFYPLRSYLIMSIYSHSHKKDSIFEKYMIDVNVKGGFSTLITDYYPFIMYFNDSVGFSRFSGIDCDMSIIYNFGAFTFPFISSSLFNEKSPYFSTFYGAYAVKPNDDNRRFGFDGDDLNVSEAVLVPKFDLTELVLFDLGCENISFDYSIDDIKKNDNGFYVIDATITTNSMSHRYEGFKRNYLQYGRPFLWIQPEESFKVTDYHGRIYASYIEKDNITLFYYIITQDMAALEECDEHFLSEIQ
ncbi:MAG: hypothetical protein JXQ23_04595 [Clostridia bacterium]|nr:hypothetical protein [Clostridia bacterium]